jgi:glutathione S-transferase
MKPKTPFGQLPVLCFDGVEIAQSMAVARFLGKEFGLAGATNVENALMDAIVDAISDATEKQYTAYLFEKDETKKVELQKKFNEEVLPGLLKNLEKGVTGEHLVGGKVSWADIVLYHFVKELPSQDALKDAPKVAAVVDGVANLPNIKKWVETRPKTSL